MQKRRLGGSDLEVSTIGAAGIEITPDDLREIDSAASKIAVHGARYPEHIEQMTGR